MVSDSSLIAQLRAKAVSERKLGDECYARAETYDLAADQLEGKAVLGAKGITVAPARQRSLSVTHPASVAGVQQKKGKGKPAGAISMRWRKNFATIYLVYGADFNIENAISAVKATEGKERRPSEMRRLFQTNIEHGTLELLGEDWYHMTAKLIGMISEATEHEGPPVSAGEPNVGGVAERLIASESKSDGVGVQTTPVGSNPTASAPSNADIFAGISLAPSTPYNL